LGIQKSHFFNKCGQLSAENAASAVPDTYSFEDLSAAQPCQGKGKLALKGRKERGREMGEGNGENGMGGKDKRRKEGAGKEGRGRKG